MTERAELPPTLQDVANRTGRSLIESAALDQHLAASGLAEDTRRRIWATAIELLSHGPVSSSDRKSTVLALGRIQSGKTTAITATVALARDLGYRFIVAILGSTKLLVEQNTSRLLDALNIGSGLRSTYGWIHVDSQTLSDSASRRFSDAVASDRTVLVTTLKHPRHLEKLSRLLKGGRFTHLPALIIDDEADQASLNVQVLDGGDSPTHKSIGDLYEALDDVLYAQFTATPYAPLLIEPTDVLSPRTIVVLEPGSGYTGAKEFFVDNADSILRTVPDRESKAEAPSFMPRMLREALASFMVGAAWLLALDETHAPVSMLAHSSHRTDTHNQLNTLIRQELEKWDSTIREANTISDLPLPVITQINDLTFTTREVPPANFLDSLRRVQTLRHIWVVNSKADENRVDWSISPAHILIGGNKLDRGFTVEGLTVTYLSRPRSAQLDTLYQRARAFGYRNDYLPFCRFYASQSTLRSFRAGIETDLAMRESIANWIRSGRDVRLWSSNEPLLLERGIRPTRADVIAGVDVRDLAGWHFATRPSLRSADIAHNRGLVEEVGLLEADQREFGRLSHRFIEVPVDAAARLIKYWKCDGKCGFENSAVADFITKMAEAEFLDSVPLVYLEGPDGRPRERAWSPMLGITALLQGRSRTEDAASDDFYIGDRYLLGGMTHIQVHRLHLRGTAVDELLTIAVRIGEESPITTQIWRT